MSKPGPEDLARVALPGLSAGWLSYACGAPPSVWRARACWEFRHKRRHMTWLPYQSWLNPGDNAWQMTAATFVGLMSLPGLAVLYGGVMQKRWSVNSMMLTFVAFCGDPDRVGSVGVQDGIWRIDRPQRRRDVRGPRVPGDGPGQTRECPGRRGRGGPGADPVDLDGAAVPLPDVLARVLPVRVRRHHPDPRVGVGVGARELQGLDPLRGDLDHGRVHGQRLPDLGWRLLVRPTEHSTTRVVT